jgi:hypothetical protein
VLGEQRHQVVEIAARVIGAAVARESKAQRGAMGKRKFSLQKERPEPVFVNVYGAQESIPRNRFRQPM